PEIAGGFPLTFALTFAKIKPPNAARRGQIALLGKPAMPITHLTQRAVGKLVAPHPDGKQTIYWDDELRGFGVQCSGKTTQRLYIAQRDVNGRARRVTLGAVNEIKFEVARQRAENMLDELRRGIDPKKRQKTYTLREALSEYLGPKDKKAEHPTLRPASVA